MLSPRTWRLGDLSAKHALLRAGLGWGTMPEPTVAADLLDGRLVRLDIEETDSHVAYPLRLIRRANTRPGPAARWLADRFALDHDAAAAAAVATSEMAAYALVAP